MERSYELITEQYARTVVVGDIHGCYAELLQLLHEIRFSDNDLLIAVGDMVDRGPGTWDVVRFFYETPNAHSVLGNHERRLAGTVCGTSKPAWSQQHSLSNLPENEHAFWADYLGALPAVIETEHAIVTHARLEPDMPIDQQVPYHTCAVGGHSVHIERNEHDVPLWFYELQKAVQCNKPICIGHVMYANVDLIPGQLYALDTGAAKGGCLTAILLPENRIMQIRAERNYYEDSRLEWAVSAIEGMAPQQLPINKYYDFKKKGTKTDFEEQAVEGFERYLESVELTRMAEQLEYLLTKIYGEMPSAGKERGEYFLSLKEKHPAMNKRLLHLILSSKGFSIDRFLKLYQGKTLLFALEELEILEKEGMRILADHYADGEPK